MNRILKIFTSRIFTWIMLMLIQILWFVGVFYVFSANFAWIGRVIEVLAFLMVLTIVNKQDNPSYKLAWTVLILALPVLGVACYMLIGWSNITKRNRIRLQRFHKETSSQLMDDDKVIAEIGTRSRGASKQAGYISKWSDYPVHHNAGIKYFSCGDGVLEPILADIETAKEYIFMEFFIIQEGVFLDNILDALERKAKEGVEIRFMYDDMGSVSTVEHTFDEKIRKRGIQCVKFNPLRPLLSVIMNNRDHRKIIVIDGKIGYTGGFNLADEYINKVERFGYWKDTGLRLIGEPVSNLTAMFLEMWQYATNKPENTSKYFIDYSKDQWELEEGFVQPYADSPLDKEKVGETVYLNIINRAKDYIYIFTPYLIIDNEMMTALCNAAKSGVDVRIVCPGIPDKKLVFMLTQSYYGQLIKAGVHIYEYSPGFIHAKNFVCDDVIATVGTINLDYRSLYMHFECGVWMYRTPEVMVTKEDALKTIAQSREITMDEIYGQSWIKSTMQGILRMFAPLL